jgi:hypothetical protein
MNGKEEMSEPACKTKAAPRLKDAALFVAQRISQNLKQVILLRAFFG